MTSAEAEEDRSADLVEDIVDAIAFGDVAESFPSFRIHRPESATLEVDFGGSDSVYIVTVARTKRESASQ